MREKERECVCGGGGGWGGIFNCHDMSLWSDFNRDGNNNNYLLSVESQRHEYSHTARVRQTNAFRCFHLDK